jgi:hypothetical protein
MDVQMPTPINVNKLKGILAGAKQIMDKVETGDYSTGNIDGRALNEQGIQDMMAEGITRPQGAVAPQMNSHQPMYKNMETSKMPSAIKEAMMQTPIPQMTNHNHTFNLSDVQETTQPTNKPMVTAQNYPSTPQTNQHYQQQHYQQPMGANGNGTFTVSESGLRAIMNDMLLEFMAKTFTQNLSEDVIKKTINTLIKEGKVGVRKKTS